ncbi:MAG: HlyC/CorC family transporter [Pseudorhodoplanes sp.]|nr:HlyC/CorC family transporter [Pseudorhodoplanes sp.]
MPDTEGPSRREPANETRKLPVAVPEILEPARESTFGRWLRTLLGWRSGSMRADLKVVLEEGAPSETGFSPQESAMLRNILGLRERRIVDVMVPRADIISVQQDIALGELVKVFETAAHSRLVVYDDTLDDPIGMVHIRDLIAFMTRTASHPKPKSRRKSAAAGLDLAAIDLSMPLKATKIVRPILFVPPSMPALDLLAKMQTTRIHLALVVDEYGGTDGIVSIEDIVEQIVGDIEDEHDQEAPSIIRQADGSFVADARAMLEDVTATVGTNFDVGEDINVETLGGYLVSKIGRVPLRGELVPGPGAFEIEIIDADPRRVKRVRILRGKARRSERGRDPAAAAAPSGGTDAQAKPADRSLNRTPQP